MDGLQVAELPRIVREETRYLDTMRLAETEHGDASPKLRWRWALFELVLDALRVVHHDAEEAGQPIWKEAARFRATGFLELALADLFGSRLPNAGHEDFKADLPSISRLAHCYLSLQHDRVRVPIACEDILQDTCLGLAAAYHPAIRTLNIQASSCPVRLHSGSRRALLLFISCVVQGMLGRASRLGNNAHALLTLSTLEPSIVNLQIETCDSNAEVFASPEYEIAIKLAAILEAEFICLRSPANGTILDLRFSTALREASLAQCARR